MRKLWTGGRMVALGLAMMVAGPLTISAAAAKSAHAKVSRVSHGRTSHAAYRGGGGLQCVPFARENTGIELSGNAYTWWNNAVGVYERGSRPEVGSILSFRANGRMRLGHVAVVTRVIDPRNLEIDHSNWSGAGRVTRNIQVIDVSPGNDWTAVRVELTRDGNSFGSIYPTNGFIYDRPDHGVMVANTQTAPLPADLNSAPRDLRPVSERYAAAGDDTEVAEAPDDTPVRSSRRYARGGTHHHTGSTAARASTSKRGGSPVHQARATGARHPQATVRTVHEVRQPARKARRSRT